MRILQKISFVVALFLMTSIAYGQDIHFSQFSFSPMNLNPAQTGVFDGDYRFVGNYRNQWATVAVPYNTVSFSGDMKAASFGKDFLGTGLAIFWDRAGDSRFTSLHVNASVSFAKSFGRDTSHTLSLGLQPGIVNRSIQYQYLYFDNQFNGDEYDPNITPNETFDKDKFNYFDLGAGIQYQYQPKDRLRINGGYAIAHLLQPKQTFFEDEDIKLDPRHTTHIKAQFPVGAKVDLIPDLIYQRQDTKQEFVIGMLNKVYLKQRIKGNHIAFYSGAYYRWNDAVIAMTGLQHNNLYIGLSYDVNVSGLTPASNTYGGIEASVIYIIKKVENVKVKGKICPIF